MPDVLTQKETRLDFINAHGSSVKVFPRQCARILRLAAAAARWRDHRCCRRCGKWLHVYVQLLHTPTDTNTHVQRQRDTGCGRLKTAHFMFFAFVAAWSQLIEVRPLCFTLCGLFTLLSRSPSSRPTAAAGNGLPSAAAAVACCVAHFPAAPYTQR